MFSKKGLKITNDEFIQRLNSLGFDPVDEYINSYTSIRFKCKNCNKIYKRKPKELSSIKCKCLNKHNDYVLKVSKDFYVLEQYKNIRYKILHKCKKCKLEFKTSPKSIINSVNGCPSCSGKKFSTDSYISKLPKDIKLLSLEYKGSAYYHLHKCNNCNFEWKTKPNYILHMNTSCPNCSSSKGEKIISQILNELSITYQKEYVVNIGGINYRFDFFIPKLNTIIEYDGIQHFMPIDYFGGEEYFQRVQENDSIKNKWCKENSYNLIRIPYNSDIKLLLSNLV